MKHGPILRLLVGITLSACGTAVSPTLDSSDAREDASSPGDVTRADAEGEPRIAAIYAFATNTIAFDTRGRAYGWGFMHFEGSGEYREPHRIAQLDGAQKLRSVESTLTCAIFTGELRCSVLREPWQRVAWARDVVDYGITTSPQLGLWVSSRDGRVRFIAGRSLQNLTTGFGASSDGEVSLFSPATSIDCTRERCCATGDDWRVQCWGNESPRPRGTIDPRSVSFETYGSRVFFSHKTETYCVAGARGAVSCWGAGVYDAFALRRSTPPQPPESVCSTERGQSVACVRAPGFTAGIVADESEDTAHSMALVFNGGLHWSVEGPPAPWASSLAPMTVPLDVAATRTVTTLWGLYTSERLSVGGSHACWTKNERRAIVCAGSNFAGQLGIDRRVTRDSQTPVDVALPL